MFSDAAVQQNSSNRPPLTPRSPSLQTPSPLSRHRGPESGHCHSNPCCDARKHTHHFSTVRRSHSFSSHCIWYFLTPVQQLLLTGSTGNLSARGCGAPDPGTFLFKPPKAPGLRGQGCRGTKPQIQLLSHTHTHRAPACSGGFAEHMLGSVTHILPGLAKQK